MSIYECHKCNARHEGYGCYARHECHERQYCRTGCGAVVRERMSPPTFEGPVPQDPEDTCELVLVEPLAVAAMSLAKYAADMPLLWFLASEFAGKYRALVRAMDPHREQQHIKLGCDALATDRAWRLFKDVWCDLKQYLRDSIAVATEGHKGGIRWMAAVWESAEACVAVAKDDIDDVFQTSPFVRGGDMCGRGGYM